MALMVYDVDGTVLRGDSNDLFFRCLIRRGVITPDYLSFNRRAGEMFVNGTLDIGRYYGYVIAVVKGRTEEELGDLLTDYRENWLRPRVSPQAAALIASQRAEGHAVILASATIDLLVRQTARILGADGFVCTRVRYDAAGRVLDVYPDYCHREGKRERLLAFCRERNLDLRGSRGYGDTVNDVPLLETVERAFVANPGSYNRNLCEIAARRGWEIVHF